MRGVGSCPTAVGAISRGWSGGAQGRGRAGQKSEGMVGMWQGCGCGGGWRVGHSEDAVGKVEKMAPGGGPLSSGLHALGCRVSPPVACRQLPSEFTQRLLLRMTALGCQILNPSCRGSFWLVAVVASLVWPQEMLQWELYAEFSTTDPTQGISTAPWAVRDSTVGWGVVMTFFVTGTGIKGVEMQLLCLPGPGPPSPPHPLHRTWQGRELPETLWN